MKNSNLHSKWEALDKQERRELAAAVKAHGGQYVFIDCESDNAEVKWRAREDYEDLPIVHASNKYQDGYEDYYVTKVVVDENNQASIYGFSTEYGSPTCEEYLEYIMYSHIGYITDMIPEINGISDVSER